MNWNIFKPKIKAKIYDEIIINLANANDAAITANSRNNCPCGNPNCMMNTTLVNPGVINTSTSAYTTYNTPLIIFCRLCGNKMIDGYNQMTNGYNTIILCDKCLVIWENYLLKQLIPPDSKVHCFKCYSHINACQCDGKKAIDNIKK